MPRRAVEIAVLAAALGLLLIGVLWMNGKPQKTYSNADFGFSSVVSEKDGDGDGVDDQTDFLQSVRAYIGTKPKYQSRYYESGYPDDGYGVCTDVVAFGMRGAGYDLMTLVSRDIDDRPGAYAIEEPDSKIDFRRVRNLRVYLEQHALSLTTELNRPEEWQGGDIVVFQKHIGVVSDRRNRRGVPLVIHHANRFQRSYEEDILEKRSDIVGHYRLR